MHGECFTGTVCGCSGFVHRPGPAGMGIFGGVGTNFFFFFFGFFLGGEGGFADGWVVGVSYFVRGVVVLYFWGFLFFIFFFFFFGYFMRIESSFANGWMDQGRSVRMLWGSADGGADTV